MSWSLPTWWITTGKRVVARNGPREDKKDMRRSSVFAKIAGAALALGVTATVSQAQTEDWDIYMTVDNQFAVYFGTPTATNFVAGAGNDWAVEYNFPAIGRLPTDYLYVATASDQNVAQGFIGTFNNVTTSATVNTGSAAWEVFPAGAYAATNPFWPSPWTASLMPTQTEVDTAIAYATANSLWVTPTGGTGYDNDPSTSTSPFTYPWGYYANIQQSAQWIWYESGNDSSGGTRPTPLDGFNHDEFLVFRIAGAAPEPATAGLMALGGLGLLRRRRSQIKPRLG